MERIRDLFGDLVDNSTGAYICLEETGKYGSDYKVLYINKSF
jgi:hypothetical protein